MKKIIINDIPGYVQWRTAARTLLSERIAPEHVIWKSADDQQIDLFAPRDEFEGEGLSPAKNNTILAADIKVPKRFIELAETVLCHNDPCRFDLMYRVLYRLNFENKALLHLKTDDDIIKARKLEKAVRRDAYKIKAYVRFRKLTYQSQDIYVAWHEPEHYTLERVTDFFTTRFKNMKWSILTPYRGAHWNGKALMLEDNPDPAMFPKDDDIERYWLTYYQNIFNPARLKMSAMLNQMPKKYWKTMPETVLIKDMIETADKKTREMIEKSNSLTD